jgi:hypothetical protein
MRAAWMVSMVAADDDDPKPVGAPIKRQAGSSVEIRPYSGGHFVVRKTNRIYDVLDPVSGQDGLLLSQEIDTKRRSGRSSRGSSLHFQSGPFSPLAGRRLG